MIKLRDILTLGGLLPDPELSKLKDPHIVSGESYIDSLAKNAHIAEAENNPETHLDPSKMEDDPVMRQMLEQGAVWGLSQAENEQFTGEFPAEKGDKPLEEIMPDDSSLLIGAGFALLYFL